MFTIINIPCDIHTQEQESVLFHSTKFLCKVKIKYIFMILKKKTIFSIELMNRFWFLNLLSW